MIKHTIISGTTNSNSVSTFCCLTDSLHSEWQHKGLVHYHRFIMEREIVSLGSSQWDTCLTCVLFLFVVLCVTFPIVRAPSLLTCISNMAKALLIFISDIGVTQSCLDNINVCGYRWWCSITYLWAHIWGFDLNKMAILKVVEGDTKFEVWSWPTG